MSFRSYTNDDDDDNIEVLGAVRIIQVEAVNSQFDWMWSLGQRARPKLFGAPQNKTQETWTYEKALRKFRGQTRGNSNDDGTPSEIEDEPLDIDALLENSASGDDYDQNAEARFASLRSLIGIHAKCLVEYTATTPSAKRSRARLRASVWADWPLLCDSVWYEIGATRDVSLSMRPDHVCFSTTHTGGYIRPVARTRATLEDLTSLLLHVAESPPQSTNARLRTLFPTLFGEPATDRCVHETLQGPDGGPVSVERRMECTFEIKELRALIDRGVIMGWHVVDTPTAIFTSMTAFFFSIELNRVALAFDTKRAWFDVLARGRTFVTYVDALLVAAPHILCFRELKRREIANRQAELKLMIKSDSSHGVRSQREYECAAVRGLLVLPERTLMQFRTSTASGVLGMSPEQINTISVAIDVYGLMQHDQGARDDLYVNQTHRRRVQDSEHGMTSGHMFTVIDSTPRSALVGYNSASSIGAVCLDDCPGAPPTGPDRQGK